MYFTKNQTNIVYEYVENLKDHSKHGNYIKSQEVNKLHIGYTDIPLHWEKSWKQYTLCWQKISLNNIFYFRIILSSVRILYRNLKKISGVFFSLFFLWLFCLFVCFVLFVLFCFPEGRHLCRGKGSKRTSSSASRMSLPHGEFPIHEPTYIYISHRFLMCVKVIKILLFYFIYVKLLSV